MPRLPDFSVVVWLRKTDKFAALKTEIMDAAVAEPYESTEYQGMVDFHWSVPNLADAERLAEALKAAARHPELVLLHIMSRVDGVDSISIKDERRTRHWLECLPVCRLYTAIAAVDECQLAHRHRHRRHEFTSVLGGISDMWWRSVPTLPT
jgi:hypothetical protein